jgi:hypothetical protein
VRYGRGDATGNNHYSKQDGLDVEQMGQRLVVRSLRTSFHNARHCENEELLTGNYAEQRGNWGSVLARWSDCDWRKTLVLQR